MDREAPLLRRVERPDIDAVSALVGAALPGAAVADPEVYAWRYFANPFGEPSCWLWESEGRPIAHAGGYVVPGHVLDRPVTFLRSADSVTDPDHFGRGLYGTLARRRDRAAAAQGCAATVSFTPDGLPGLGPAGGVFVGPVDVWVSAADERRLAAITHLPAPIVAALRRVVFGALPADGDERDGPPDGLETLAHDPQRCGVRRNQEWWRWRYRDHPSVAHRWFAVRRGGELVGACVTGPGQLFGLDFVRVLEAYAADTEAARHLLGTALAEPGAVAGASIAALPGSRAEALAVAAGFIRIPSTLLPQPTSLIVSAHRRRSGIGQPWEITWGDD